MDSDIPTLLVHDYMIESQVPIDLAIQIITDALRNQEGGQRMQSRWESFKEVGLNVGVGLIGAIIITRLTFHFIDNLNIASFVSCGSCTVWSIVRGYSFRRYFAKRKG